TGERHETRRNAHAICKASDGPQERLNHTYWQTISYATPGRAIYGGGRSSYPAHLADTVHCSCMHRALPSSCETSPARSGPPNASMAGKRQPPLAPPGRAIYGGVRLSYPEHLADTVHCSCMHRALTSFCETSTVRSGPPNASMAGKRQQPFARTACAGDGPLITH